MFPDKLKKLMKQRDISAAELSRTSELTEAALSCMLSSKTTDPRLSTVEKIAKALQVSPEYFFDIEYKDDLSHYSKEERTLILSEEYLPWIKVTKEAIDRQVPPEVFSMIIDLIKMCNTKKI